MMADLAPSNPRRLPLVIDVPLEDILDAADTGEWPAMTDDAAVTRQMPAMQETLRPLRRTGLSPRLCVALSLTFMALILAAIVAANI
jgi:hypothetical protein